MLVHVITDTLTMVGSTRSILEPQFKVTWALLEDNSADTKRPDAIVVAVDLHDVGKIEVLRSRLGFLAIRKSECFCYKRRAIAM
jgi:hypothetical protein